MSALVWWSMTLLLVAAVVAGILWSVGLVPVAVLAVLLVLYWICSVFDCYGCAKNDFDSSLDALKTVVTNKDEYSEKFWTGCLRMSRVRMVFAPIIGPVYGIGVALYCLIVVFLIFLVAPVVCFSDNLEWRKKYR